MSHDQSFAWRNGTSLSGLGSGGRGVRGPHAYAPQALTPDNHFFVHRPCISTCATLIRLVSAFLFVPVFNLLSARVMLTFSTSPTQRLWNATPQPATRNSPFSNDDITADVAETSSAASILRTPFRLTSTPASILRALRIELVTRASATTEPGRLPGQAGTTASTPAKASSRRRRLWVYQTRIRPAGTPPKLAAWRRASRGTGTGAHSERDTPRPRQHVSRRSPPCSSNCRV